LAVRSDEHAIHLHSVPTHALPIFAGTTHRRHRPRPLRKGAMTMAGYKIVPDDVDSKSMSQKTQELRTMLAANIAVATNNQDLEAAAVYQQHLDTLDVLIENSRDRV